MVTVSRVFMWISILTTCGTLISFSTAVGVTGVCREDVFTKFTNFTVTAESIDLTVSNVAYCKRQCRDVGCDQMFSFMFSTLVVRCVGASLGLSSWRMQWMQFLSTYRVTL